MLTIVILGLILVALMVYTSTRIKRSAAAAFAAETVETDDFIIQKPDGFLNVIDPEPPHAFEAYSKGFGGPRDSIRFATASLTVRTGTSIEEAIGDIDDEVVSDIGEVIGERHYRVVEAKRKEKDLDFRVLHKLAEKGGSTYDLEMIVFDEIPDDFLHAAEAMLASFELK
jgi:hypothetical protein